jgi:flagellar basal-body rod modification protein FlgD
MSFMSPVATDTRGVEKTTGSQQSLGKDDFLKLLITKMQFQDPLSPMEDEAFISQLAQFATLEQMNNIADGIDLSNDLDFLQSQSLSNTMAAGLIGKEVEATYRGLYLDEENEPIANFTTDKWAETITFRIKDSHGNTVAKVTMEDVGIGVHKFTWDGLDNLGNRADVGYYRVEATAIGHGADTFSPSLSLSGLVDSVIYREGTAYLTVGKTEILLGDVTKISQPKVEIETEVTESDDSESDDDGTDEG